MQKAPEDQQQWLKYEVRRAKGQLLSAAERQRLSRDSLDWFAQMARGELPGYDLKNAKDSETTTDTFSLPASVTPSLEDVEPFMTRVRKTVEAHARSITQSSREYLSRGVDRFEGRHPAGARAAVSRG